MLQMVGPKKQTQSCMLKGRFFKNLPLKYDICICSVEYELIVIPKCLCEDILSDLHQGHSGIVGMKALARMHVW